MSLQQQNGIVLEEQGGSFAAPPATTSASRGGDYNEQQRVTTTSSKKSTMTANSNVIASTTTATALPATATAAANRATSATIIDSTTPTNKAPTTTKTTKIHDLTPHTEEETTTTRTNAGRVSPDNISALTEVSAKSCNAIAEVPSRKKKPKHLISVIPPDHHQHPLAVWDSKADAKSFANAVCDQADEIRKTLEQRGFACSDEQAMQVSIHRVENYEQQYHESQKEMRGYAVEAYHRQEDREQNEKLHRENIDVQHEEKDWVNKLTAERDRCLAALSTYTLYSAAAFALVKLLRIVPYLIYVFRVGTLFTDFGSCSDSDASGGGGYFSALQGITAYAYNFVGVGKCYGGLLLGYVVAPVVLIIITVFGVNKLPEVIQKSLYTAIVAFAALYLGLVSIPYIACLAVTFLVIFVAGWLFLKREFSHHKANLKTKGSYPTNKDLNDALESFDDATQFLEITPVISLLLGLLFAMIKSMIWD